MLRDIMIALALSNMIFVNVWLKFFYKEQFYMRFLPTANSFLALILNELLFAAVFWCGIQILRHFKKQLISQFLWRIAQIFICLEVLLFIYVISDSNDLLKNILILSMILLITCKLMTKTALKILLISSPFVLIIFGQAITGIVGDLSQPAPSKPATAFFKANSSVPRLVWLVFDETDQSIAFSNRPKSLNLPEFDRFKAEALSAENAYPPSNQTMSSFPAFIDGKMISNAVGEGPDKLALTYKGSKETVYWGTRPNIFTKARDLKVSTAMVGEFVPFSRVIGKDLTFSDWRPYKYDYGTPKNTIISNMGAQIFGVFNTLALPWIQHKRSNLVIVNHAKRLVADVNYGLVMVHFPVPHCPYIYKQNWWESSKTE